MVTAIGRRAGIGDIFEIDLRADGTESDPAVGFEADDDTGYFRPGSDQFGITAGGAERLRLNTSDQLILAGDLDTHLSHPAADTLRLTTGGESRVEAGTGELVINEPGNDIDLRVESTNETGMLFVDAAEDQAVVHGTSDPNYGALFVQGRTSGSGADQDIVSTLGEDDEDIQLNGNNTGTVQNVQVQAGNWTSNNAVSPNIVANLRIEGVPTFGPNVTPTDVYAFLIQNRAGDTDWFRVDDSGTVEVPSGDVDLLGNLLDNQIGGVYQQRGADPGAGDLDAGEVMLYVSDGSADATGDARDLIYATNNGGTIETTTIVDADNATA